MSHFNINASSGWRGFNVLVAISLELHCKVFSFHRYGDNLRLNAVQGIVMLNSLIIFLTDSHSKVSHCTLKRISTYTAKLQLYTIPSFLLHLWHKPVKDRWSINLGTF